MLATSREPIGVTGEATWRVPSRIHENNQIRSAADTTELLELCEQFLRQASPTVHTELRQFLTENGYRTGGLGWFLDTLGFTTLNHAHPQ